MGIFFTDPRLPALLGLLTACLLGAAAAITSLPAVTWGALQRVARTAPRGVALGGGAATAISIVVIGQALDLHGTAWVGVLLIALLAGLVLGVYVPGLEARRHAARRNRLAL